MNPRISVHDFTLYWRLSGEILSFQPWGPDGARVRATNLRDFPEIPGALLDPPPAPGAAATLAEGKGILTKGKLRAEIWPDGTLHFFFKGDINVVLQRLGAMQVTDLTIEEPTLEEIFMHYYE